MAIQDYSTGQPSKRRYQKFRDQHGRLWGGTVDIKSGMPCSQIEPLGFKAPWLPDPIYFKFDPHELGVFSIDYRRMVADIEHEERRYQKLLSEAAVKLYGDRAGEVLKNPSPLLLDTVGAKPPNKVPIQAAATGNRWILGLTDKMPKWAESLKLQEERVVRVRDEDSDVSVGFEDLEGQFPDVDETEEEEKPRRGRKAATQGASSE